MFMSGFARCLRPCACSRTVRRAHRISSAIRFGGLLLVFINSCSSLNLFAQTLDHGPDGDSDHSWTITTDVNSTSLTPARIIERHNKDGNHTVDVRSLQIRQSDGHFEPYEDVEKETLQVDDSTVRTTTRTFFQDVNRRKILTELTDEQQHTSQYGASSIVRLTYSADVNGALQPMRREIVETKRTGKDIQETNSTLMLPSINGGLVPARKTRELTKRTTAGTLQSEVTTQIEDGVGNWQLIEAKQIVVSQKGEEKITEERVSRRDASGNPRESSLVVRRQSVGVMGERREVVETYSVDVSGMAPDGKLHLVARETNVTRASGTGEHSAEQQIENHNPGDLHSDVRLSTLVSDTVRRGVSGMQGTRTVRARNLNGSLEVVEVDMTTSDSSITIHFPSPHPGQ